MARAYAVVLAAWSVRFVGWAGWVLAGWVDCRCFLSFVFLGVARRLELSPCNHAHVRKQMHVYRNGRVNAYTVCGRDAQAYSRVRTENKLSALSAQSRPPTRQRIQISRAAYTDL